MASPVRSKITASPPSLKTITLEGDAGAAFRPKMTRDEEEERGRQTLKAVISFPEHASATRQSGDLMLPTVVMTKQPRVFAAVETWGASEIHKL